MNKSIHEHHDAPPKAESLESARAESLSEIAGLCRAGSQIGARGDYGDDVVVELYFTYHGTTTTHTSRGSVDKISNLNTTIGELYRRLAK